MTVSPVLDLGDRVLYVAQEMPYNPDPGYRIWPAIVLEVRPVDGSEPELLLRVFREHGDWTVWAAYDPGRNRLGTWHYRGGLQ